MVFIDKRRFTAAMLWLALNIIFSIFPVKASAQETEFPIWARNERKKPLINTNGDWLVSGEITSVSQTSTEAIVSIHIQEVYAGPPALVDRSFDAQFQKENRHVRLYDHKYLERFAKGQRILVVVAWYNQDDKPEGGKLIYSRGYGFPLPTVLDDGPQSKELLQHANFVRATYQATTEEQKTLLKKYALGNIPWTTLWATRSIANWDNVEGNDFLKMLAKDKDRSLSQLILIETLLRKSWGLIDWRTSPERINLLMRIAKADQGLGAGLEPMDALSTVSQEGSINDEQMNSIWKAFLKNPTVSIKWQQRAALYNKQGSYASGKNGCK